MYIFVLDHRDLKGTLKDMHSKWKASNWSNKGEKSNSKCIAIEVGEQGKARTKLEVR